MAKKASFKEESEDVKSELLRKCEDAGCGKKDMIFRLNNDVRSVFIPARDSIRVEGSAVNLCYSKKFNSPFLDENEGADKIKLRAINISDGAIVVSANDRTLQMYLLLSSFHGKFYSLVDKDKENRSVIVAAELKADAFDKIRTAKIEALRAAWYVVFKGDPGKRDSQDLAADLYGRANDTPKIVLEAFSDESAKNKFLLYTAIRGGVVSTDENMIVLSWKSGAKILTVSPGQDMYAEFSKFVLTDTGNEVRVQIEQALAKL
jgi:hypothetical protein